MLGQVLCQSPVEDEEAGFGAPLYGALALFNQQHHLTPPRSPNNVVMCKIWNVVGIDQVGRDSGINVEEDDQYGVEALEACQKLRSNMVRLGTDGYEKHQPVLHLKSPNGFKVHQSSGTKVFALAMLAAMGRTRANVVQSQYHHQQHEPIPGP